MFKWCCAFLVLFSTLTGYAAQKAVILNINGPIGPAAQNYITRGIDRAEAENVNLIILELNTPGGLEKSMSVINAAILASPIPVVGYVSPAGGRATHTGTYIIYASHIAAMTPGSQLGAANPIPFAGGSRLDNAHLSASERDAINQYSAYIKGLAITNKRNALWAESAVREAATIPAEEAKQLNVIEELANNKQDLLQKLDQRKLVVNGKQVTLNTKDMEVITLPLDWRYDFLNVITEPDFVYILLLFAIFGIFFELANPGLIFPGAVGTICLILALYAFHLLSINYLGLTLILTGLTFMTIEIYVTNYGILGLGGIIAFIIGSIMLFNTENPSYHLSLALIFMMSLASFFFFYLLSHLAIQAHKKAIVTGRDALVGSEGEVISIKGNKLMVRVLGEIWEASAPQPLQTGQKIVVKGSVDLLLRVVPKQPQGNNRLT